MNAFYDALVKRRSVYTISDEKTVSEERIEEVLRTAMLHAPSANDSRSSRALLLFGGESKALWDIVLAALEKVTKPERFPTTQKKIAAFAAGYGTIAFFEDDEVVKGLEEKYPTYKETYRPWSYQSSGMLQWILWSALELEGLGASLQHYNPLIDDAVKERWKLPASWRLISQMPFGAPTDWPAPKDRGSLEHRLIVAR